MGCVLKQNTIQQRLERYFRAVQGLMAAFTVTALLLSLTAVGICRNMLAVMTEAEAFFEEAAELERLLENHLLYTDALDTEHIQKLQLQMYERLELLKKSRISSGFYRDILDLGHAVDMIADGVDNMPQNGVGANVLRAYYKQDYVYLQHAFKGIQLEKQMINSKLLAAGDELQHQLTRMIYQCAFFGFILTALGVLGMHHSGRRLGEQISRPIETLTQEVIQEQNCCVGQMQPILKKAESVWEVDKLTEAFNRMIEQIHMQWTQLQEKAKIEKHLHEQEMENLRMAGRLQASQMQALQRQINPHFLFNTLNMILDTAYLEEAPETMELLRSAAAFLRYALDCCEKRVTLGREIEALGEYVFLQEKRFGDRIQFRFELDETLNDINLPALTLQPLVENAVAHGVAVYAQDAEVVIETARMPDGRIRVAVHDNGVGMNEITLAHLREQIACPPESSEDARFGIGLLNVARKLQVFYKGQAQIHVQSAPGEGCTISLMLPDLN